MGHGSEPPALSKLLSSPGTEPPVSFRTWVWGWTRERWGQGKTLKSEAPVSPSEQCPPHPTPATCQSWSTATGCSSAQEAQAPQPPGRPADLGGEKPPGRGQEAGSAPQSQWFQCINNSEHKRYTAENALLPTLLTIVLQGIHYFNYFMIGQEKHRLKKDNARVIICLH